MTANFLGITLWFSLLPPVPRPRGQWSSGNLLKSGTSPGVLLGFPQSIPVSPGPLSRRGTELQGYLILLQGFLASLVLQLRGFLEIMAKPLQ